MSGITSDIPDFFVGFLSQLVQRPHFVDGIASCKDQEPSHIDLQNSVFGFALPLMAGEIGNGKPFHQYGDDRLRRFLTRSHNHPPQED